MEIFLKLGKQTKPLCQLPWKALLTKPVVFFSPPLQKLTLSAIIQLIILVYKRQVISKC